MTRAALGMAGLYRGRADGVREGRLLGMVTSVTSSITE
jgi:hypothetical protein